MTTSQYIQFGIMLALVVGILLVVRYSKTQL